QSIYGDLSALLVLVYMILSWIVYAFLIFYLDNVWPFQHGVPKSPIFFLLPSYWCPSACATKGNCPPLNSKIFEPQPKNATSRIEIRDVCKSFTQKAAVDHLWLDIYENQLTVLLGHNGTSKLK